MLKGSIVALVTPFDSSNRVNYTRLKELIDFQLQNHTDGILLLGTTAETATLTEEEQEKIVKEAISYIDHRCFVLVGACSNSTEKSIALANKYSSYGCDAVLVISPYYNKTNESGMIKHFKTIADQVKVPIMLYNIPGRTGCNIDVSVIRALKNHPNIMGVKEASTDINHIVSVAYECHEHFQLFAGNDHLMMVILALGGAGAVHVAGNVIPKEMKEIVDLVRMGEFDLAMQLHKKYFDFLVALLIETNPIPIKELMNHLGLGVGEFRLPLDNLRIDHKIQLIETYQKIGG